MLIYLFLVPRCVLLRSAFAECSCDIEEVGLGWSCVSGWEIVPSVFLKKEAWQQLKLRASI